MTRAMTGDQLAAAAEALVGAPFRLHGRDPATGLDCVGVVLAALGTTADVRGYGLRNRSIAPYQELAAASGFVPSAGPTERGDLLLVQPGPGQHHLLIATAPGRFVHAHAGLRRVVLQPGPLPWPVERAWRLIPEET